MTDFILQHELPIRLGFFLGVFIVMALWEVYDPRRSLTVPKALRWRNNIGIVVLNTVLLRLIFPAAAVGMAIFVQTQGWGAFNYFDAPIWVEVLVSVVAMDFAIYVQHVMFHALPTLWRLHRMHHADLDFDVTTGARFHPIEIILSMLIKFCVIAALGPPAVAVVIFEVLLNATSIFNHANVRIPDGLDRVLRWFLVTPDMHRVHHSVEDDETNSNFGFNLPWWDHLLGTYRAQPRGGHRGMTIGIETFREPKHCDKLLGMLVLPFMGKTIGYAINRRQWRENNPRR